LASIPVQNQHICGHKRLCRCKCAERRPSERAKIRRLNAT